MPEELVRQVGYTNVFERNNLCTSRTIINVGGSGSSKSHSLAQLFVAKFSSEQNKQFVVARKTMPALRRSSYKLIVDLLEDYGIYSYIQHNKSDSVLSLPSLGNQMWFLGLDEPSKAKSLAGGANYIWLEEADEFTHDDFLAFVLQLRKPTEKEVNHIYLSFNPIDGNGWIPTKLVGQPNTEIIHSTVKDNPYADPEYVKALEQLAAQDENTYRVYVLGEWGRLENLLLTNYVLVDDLPEKVDAWCYGLDFGFAHPTVLMKIILSDQKLYWHECICQTKMTNSDLIERLSHFERADIYADSAEPQRIVEIARADHAIYPANKDVKLGLDICRRQTIHITKSSINTIKQIRGYHRKKDKSGQVLDEPFKFADDTIDAARYGTMGITQRFGFATSVSKVSEPIKSLTFPGEEQNKVLERWMRRKD